MVLSKIDQKSDFDSILSSGHLVVAHFYADWAPQCESMNVVLDELSKQTKLSGVKFIKCPAEDLSDISMTYDITAVPTFLLLRSGKLLDRVEGANPAELTKKIEYQAGKNENSISKPSNVVPPAENLDEEIKRLINRAPVMLFMKGTAEQPQCGFSKTIVALLGSLNAEYKIYNILSNEDIRQGLKKFSDWPTYPQLYINGEFIGGLDIVKEMNASGELENLLPKKQSLEERLKSLTNQSACMVFMKGDRHTPRCGFSRQLMEILAETGVEFETFDILGDEEVRQGLKTFSDWPTYPQVYVKGDLIGGLDIVKEMKASGELVATLKGT